MNSLPRRQKDLIGYIVALILFGAVVLFTPKSREQWGVFEWVSLIGFFLAIGGLTDWGIHRKR